MRLEDLGLVGNCQFSALVSRTGDVVWCCLPRFDSEPVFSSLLDEEGGRWLIGPADGSVGTQQYLPNTNVLETRFLAPGGSFRVLDFAPRFAELERYHRPTRLVRIVEPVEGTPMVRVVCQPRLGWSRNVPTEVQTSEHVSFDGFSSLLTLATDTPYSYLGGRPFALTSRRYFVLSWGPPALEEPLASTCDRQLRSTVAYWQRWVKHCDVPPLFQDEVIRSALALKLHCFEDTGAIVAATTTSIPEAPGSGRTWDYRYCWLRDSYYVLGALGLLGHFEEREQFVQYLLNVVGGSPSLDLAPLYRVDGTSELQERVLENWRGFEGEKPVRIGNGAATHRQNDIFGEMVLALAPVFLDERFRAERTRDSLELVERLAKKAIAVAGSPDAGIWEYRGNWRPQTFSSLMCWAGADRMARVAERHVPNRAAEYRAAADRIREQILASGWNADRRTFVGSYGGSDLDAALLQLAPLHFLSPGDARLGSTIDAIGESLTRDGWLFRYAADDGFGQPTVAFTICSFWWVEALAAAGRHDEARAVLDRARSARSPLGLLSEDYEASTARMWGNFPQAYSHVGLIHAAYAASPRWTDIL
ncbi:MAG: glycoside hydrolase family 15 protein [Deltaproteobacteria bacterium]|nr:glycoside hydrolase family 15 protein [Deltaproteobacteria bacterium]